MGSKLMQMVNNLALNFSATLLRTSAAGKIYCTSLKKFVKWGDFSIYQELLAVMQVLESHKEMRQITPKILIS